MTNLEKMRSFSLMNLPTLDIAMLAALELFSKVIKPPLLPPFDGCRRPLFIGSGNAALTAAILAEGLDAVIANESSLEQKLQTTGIDLAVLVSASGGKDAPRIAKRLKKAKIPVYLVTCNPKGRACEFADGSLVFPRVREPYTYNCSTYLGPILSKTGENAKSILTLIKDLKNTDFDWIYGIRRPSYYFLVPPGFALVLEMYRIKFAELFGDLIPFQGFTSDFAKRHATAIVRSPEMIFVSLGAGPIKRLAGNNAWVQLDLPENADYATMMSVGYWFIGLIQKSNPPWFANNLAQYCQQASLRNREDIRPIVEA